MIDFEPVSGAGVYLQDASGRQVLDLYGGHAVASLGYRHPRLTAALIKQSEALQFQSNVVPMAVRDRAADALAEFSPDGLDRVFFVNSGAEANENALKLAVSLTGRPKVVAIEHAFHGRTAAAAAVTWGAASWYGFPHRPIDVEFVPRNDIASLDDAVDHTTAAVIIEPVQGLAGAFAFAPEFLQAARQASSREGAMLIFDEVQTGMGRLGFPFGADRFEVTPDILTTAKGLAGGYPAGAVIMTDAIASELRAGQLGTTFGGAPLACAAIEAVISTIREEDLLARVREYEAAIRDGCNLPDVEHIDGAGFLIGLRTAKKASELRDTLLARNILTGTSSDPQVLRLLPPLILELEHVEHFVSVFGEVLDAAL